MVNIIKTIHKDKRIYKGTTTKQLSTFNVGKDTLFRRYKQQIVYTFFKKTINYIQ